MDDKQPDKPSDSKPPAGTPAAWAPWAKWLGYALSLILVAGAARYGIQLPAPALPVAEQPKCCCPPCPNRPGEVPPGTPPTTPPTKPEPKPDAPAALARIQFGNAGCTATVIGPRRDDGRWWVLTAAHCVNKVGDRGSMKLKDGRTFGISVVALNKSADCCWCVTDVSTETLPFAHLAKTSPPPGSIIWHAGYGVDVPGNREEGVVEAGPDQNGQIRMKLSVSSGDSGGGICLNSNNEVVSCVCCTTAKGRVAQVWGASPESIHRARPTEMALDDGWRPIDIPMRAPVPVPDVMPAVRP